MKEMQVCSQAVYDILVAFNNLSSLSEQEEVLDVIYDALYKKVLREVMSNSIISGQKAEIQELSAEIKELKAENKDLQSIIQEKKVAYEELLQSATRKRWKSTKKGLLIIISNLKHYLGDSWQTIFPNGCENVDQFLEQIDGEGIMYQDTWSRFENTVDDASGQ